MDPNAANYDRPPPGFNQRKRKRRGVLSTIANQQRQPGNVLNPRVPLRGTATSSSDAVVPPKPRAYQPDGNSGPQKGSLGTVDRFKAAGLKAPKGASEIGFFNATHKHGEPMKNLISKLKKRRQGPVKQGQSRYTP